MKNSIKRAQSQACLGFAEQKNFRPLAKHLKRLSLTLLLLITAATGAWADSFSTEAYTADATLSAVSVTGDQTLTINEGVTVTVNNGLTINSGATLTVTGGGSLVVNGATGANGSGASGSGSSGTTAIAGSGQLAIANATIIATGGTGGNGGYDAYEAGPGGDGAPAVSGVSISIQTGSLTAIGGAGGIGGTSTLYNQKNPYDGETAKAFSSFPNISDATLSYSTDNVTYTKYESGNTTLYRYMKIEPPAGPAVTIADGNTEASFKMPQYDVTATYTLKRDMTVDVAGEMADRIRIKKDGNDFQPVDATQMNPVVTDNLDAENPVTLTVTTDYTLQLQKQGDTEDDWTDVTALSVGNFRYKITGAGNYSGICYSEAFELFQGYEITVPAGEYATYYKDEPLRIEDQEADLYTIQSVSADQAVLSAAIETAPSLTPLLIYNRSDQEKTFLLIPANEEPNHQPTVAPEFQGTLEATQIAASDATANRYALNGKQFVWVKTALPVAANKAWLAVPVSTSNARRLTLVFSETTGVSGVSEVNDDSWYDLNGRKLNAVPTKKGVYILNGRKVVIK